MAADIPVKPMGSRNIHDSTLAASISGRVVRAEDQRQHQHDCRETPKHKRGTSAIMAATPLCARARLVGLVLLEKQVIPAFSRAGRARGWERADVAVRGGHAVSLSATAVTSFFIATRWACALPAPPGRDQRLRCRRSGPGSRTGRIGKRRCRAGSRGTNHHFARHHGNHKGIRRRRNAR